MNLSEEIAYLKGLAEGMQINTTSNEGKLLTAMLETMDKMAQAIDSVEFDVEVLESDVDSIEEDLDYLFDEGLEDDCDCGCHDDEDEEDYDDYEGEIYEVICPNCGEEILLDEEALDDGELNCFACGEKLELDFGGDIEAQE